jgi:hypothetical protein
MGAMGAAVGPRRYAKPYVVAERLELFTGPTGGSVRLPGHLAWSGSSEYDLDAPGRIIDLYRTVLIEAANPADPTHTSMRGPCSGSGRTCGCPRSCGWRGRTASRSSQS